MKSVFSLALWFSFLTLLVACNNDTPEPEFVSVTGVELNKNTLSLEIGQSESLLVTITPADATNKKVTWISSDPNVATVSAQGEVVALKKGNVTVIVVTEDEAKIAACTVMCDGGEEAAVPVQTVKLNKDVLSLEKGQSQTLTAVVSPDDATNKKVSWVSSNTSVLTVDNNGLVKALSPGEASVIVTSEDGGKIASCVVTVRDVGVEAPVARTILVYLAADNTLSSLAAADLTEMKKGVAKLTGSAVHLLVYIDNGNSPRLVELQKKNGEVVETIVKSYESKRNSVGLAETKEVFNDVFSNKDFRAESYGLVYWSHGDGWIPNPLPATRWVGQDTGSGTYYMNISDLVSIMKDMPHFDFVLFDACFMQSIEVAYALRTYTDYFIGSPTEIPGPGARYDILVPEMFADGDVALKTAVAYYTPYEENYNEGKGISNTNWTGGVSVGMLKSSELERLASVTKQVLSGTVDKSALLKVYDYDKRYPSSSSHVGYYDMVDMMRLLTDNSGFTAWKQVFDAALPYWNTTPMNYSGFSGMFSMEDTNGVSHYIPSSNNTAAAAYRSTDWYKDAGLSKLGW